MLAVISAAQLMLTLDELIVNTALVAALITVRREDLPDGSVVL